MNPKLQHILVKLGRQLRRDGYSFVTPTPTTHARVLRRARKSSDLLRDIFGWNHAFLPNEVPEEYKAYLSQHDLFDHSGESMRARVRFSTLDDLLIAHSGFPTTGGDAVFLGPDSYRFCRAIRSLLSPAFQPRRAFDIGAGPGTGGLAAARMFPSLRDIVLADINPNALVFAAANAILNDVPHAKPLCSDILQGVNGEADLIIGNPPYLLDPAHRIYRDGGGTWGEALALRMLKQGLDRLSSGGQLMLYTGTPVVHGRDMFLEAIRPLLHQRTRTYRYEELDPDVFGEELETSHYEQVDRIAIVVLHVTGEELLR